VLDYDSELVIEDDGRSLVVSPRGEIDVFFAPRLVKAFAGCTDAHKSIVCDLSAVEFLDSSGLRALIFAQRAEPARFAIARPSETVQRLIHLTATTELFRRADER